MQKSLFYRPTPKKSEIQKKRWKPLRIIGQAIKRTCTVLGAMVLISSIFVTISTVQILKQASPLLPEEMILVMKIDSNIQESVSYTGFPSLLEAAPLTVRQIVDALDKAKDDDRVKALIFSIKGGGIALAHIQEIREAVLRFRSSGKIAYVYSPSYGDLSQGLGMYYLASAFEKIWMQPVGMLLINGINAEIPFARTALNKIGVKPEVLQKEDYKSAYESATHESISAPNKEMMNAIINDISEDLLADIAKDRNIKPFQLMMLINMGLLTAEEALQEGLVDRLDYADILLEEVRETLGFDKEDEKPDLVTMEAYAAEVENKNLPKEVDNNNQVALIYANGTIMPTSGSSQYGGSGVGADELFSAILDASKDDDIKVIVLRINSPGGSPTASETIRRAVVKAKERGKHIIVSMGPMAASGGYWIATDAHQIFALPTTLTGSIGVVMGKFSLKEMWTKIGIHWDSISWGENADILSFNKDLSEKEYQRLDHLIESIYQNFLKRVSEGRGMTIDEARSIAKGRVWTGKSALEVGLVDQIGGLDQAFDYAARHMGLNDRNDLRIDVLPKPKSPFEQFITMFGQQVFMSEQFKKMRTAMQGFSEFFTSYKMVSEPQDYMVYDSDLAVLQ